MEMCEGIHLYSLASIYSAFDCILKIYGVLGDKASDFENNRLKEEKIQKNQKELEKLQEGIKKYINENMYDEEKKSFVRNPEDRKMDISILGAVTPFNVFKPKEKEDFKYNRKNKLIIKNILQEDIKGLNKTII